MHIHPFSNRNLTSVSGADVFRRFEIFFTLLVIVPVPILGTTKDVPPIQLAGYKAVPVRYRPLNKMIISVKINGHPANLIVDTGANQIILDASAAESFGVSPSSHGLRYVGFTQINGQLLPIAFVSSFSAGAMNFGSTSVALLTSNARSSFSNRLEGGNLRVDGVLGADILIRHKAVINCRTRFVFFKVDWSRSLQLARFALSQNFTKVPLRREENGALTVPCSVRGQPGRLLVDTGAFVTTFNEAVLKSRGIALQATRATARFTNGVARQISVGQINDLIIGNFKVPPAKFGAAGLPNFALEQGHTRIDGIVGIDLLFSSHGIIDFDGMNLFLK
jgi:predicted aspartyl protease